MTILAWDDGDQIYLIDTRGQHRSVSRAPGRIKDAIISDNGTLVVLLLEGSRLLFLTADLEPVADRARPPRRGRAMAAARSPWPLRCHRLAAQRQPLLHPPWTARGEVRDEASPKRISPLSSIGHSWSERLSRGDCGYRRPTQAARRGRLVADIAWEETVMSNVGRLTSNGDGGMILTSCYIHGVQRYDIRGHNEGARITSGEPQAHCSRTTRAVIAVATLEGELVILSPGGQVRWRTGLA